MKVNSHTPRKRFGQNFLQSDTVILKIIGALRLKSTDHLLEIGPGLGALTSHLLQGSGRLDCVEIDRDLAQELSNQFSQDPKFHLYVADALKFDLNTLEVPSKTLRIVGNLPYNITTPLLFHLLKRCDLIQDMHFMLQKEVVDRLTASPNSKAFGKLTLMVQYFCRTESLFSVPPNAFYPAPKVDSMVIRLVPYSTPPFKVNNFKLFEQICAAAFNQRRKMLSNSLKAYLSIEDFHQLDLDPKKRPEQLSLEQWVMLCNKIEQHIDKHPKETSS